jgi:predicted nucleic acid-binding Zn finger protein
MACQFGSAVVLQKKYIKLKLAVVVGPSMGGLIVANFCSAGNMGCMQ